LCPNVFFTPHAILALAKSPGQHTDTSTNFCEARIPIGFQFRGYRREKFLRGVASGLVAAAFGLALIMTPFGETFERTFGLNWLFKVRGARQPPPDITIVGINSRTGAALDLPRLPHDWSRTVHAHVIQRLVEQNVRGIIFDIDFTRPKVEDAILASAIASADRVVLFEWLAGRRERVIRSDGADAGWTWIEQLQRPAEVLAEAAKALAPFPLPKIDQAAFEFWAFKSSAGGMPTMSAVALQLTALPVYGTWLTLLKEAGANGAHDLPPQAAQLKGPKEIQQLMQTLRLMFQQNPSLQERIREALEQDRGRIDAETRKLLSALAALYAGPDNYYINFYGPPGTIRTVTYQSLLPQAVGGIASARVKLNDNMVFVGYSDLDDPDQPDRFYTSFTGKDGVDLSGVEIMATAYANLLTQRTLLPSSPLYSALVVIVFGFAVGILVYLLPATVGVAAAFAMTALYGATLQWRFNAADLWLPLATPVLVQLPLALLVGLIGQYLLERRKERQITQAIRYYLPAHVVRDLSERQVDPTTLNRVVFGTCLATDMSDFIALGETKTPQDLALFMNAYFDALAQSLTRHGVDVLEYRADMIMCAWVAPVRSPSICRKATEAAVEVSEIILRFAQQHGSRHFSPRVGLHDGNVYVGHTGGGGRFLYSIVGDAANTAARLESLNKQLGTHMLAAQSVVQDWDGILLRPLGLIRLKGKMDPTWVCEILGKKEGAKREHLDLCAQFAEGLAAFQRKEWLGAAGLFQAVNKSFSDDGPSKFFWERCQKYALDPPFEGPVIIQMDEK
jgi:adenylate cyclase